MFCKRETEGEQGQGKSRSASAIEGGEGASNCVKHLMSNYLVTMTILGQAMYLMEATHVCMYSTSIHVWFRIHSW